MHNVAFSKCATSCEILLSLHLLTFYNRFGTSFSFLLKISKIVCLVVMVCARVMGHYNALFAQIAAFIVSKTQNNAY